jgi:hypothetical protein
MVFTKFGNVVLRRFFLVRFGSSLGIALSALGVKMGTTARPFVLLETREICAEARSQFREMGRGCVGCGRPRCGAAGRRAERSERGRTRPMVTAADGTVGDFLRWPRVQIFIPSAQRKIALRSFSRVARQRLLLYGAARKGEGALVPAPKGLKRHGLAADASDGQRYQ